ncbi:MAG: terminase family protein [Bacillota bacterium]|nr:terminase family protein [Bacillota bacterium]
MKKVLWRPQPRQAEFLRRREYEVLYGGAAGGGKSEAAVMLPLYWVGVPWFRALILRKSFPQLRELIDKSLVYYGSAFPGARYNVTAHRWTFPSGATVSFGSMYGTADREKYRGLQFDLIIFDELTHFTWAEYSFMFSRNRPAGPGTFVGMRGTTNPGGVGHGWVKNRFITAAPPMTPIVEEVEVGLPEGGTKRMTRSRLFVPATVFDNRALLTNDPGYLANLGMLPEAERNAQLYGSWDSFEGQVFTEWRDDPAHYVDRRWSHVIAPFRIPGHWTLIRGFDWGYSRPFSVGWWAVDEDGRLYRIAEYYGCGGAPDRGLRLEVAELARRIRAMEQENENLKGREIMGVADPAIAQRDGGDSIADIMARERVFWGKGDNTRLAGKMQYHYRLAFDGEGLPMLYAFRTCRHFIRTLPALVYDPGRVEDVDTRGEDHAYDEGRYVLMERPITPRTGATAPRAGEDPLNMKGGSA